MHTYEAQVEWTREKQGAIKGPNKADISMATPPEFGGPEKGFWSPEELFVGSIAGCILSTFLFFVEKSSIGLVSYQSTATGRLDKTSEGLRFQHLGVDLRITVKTDKDREKVERLKSSLEKYCPVSAAQKQPVHLELNVETTN